MVKEEKRQRYDNVPYGDVMERLISLTFPADHPYGHTTIGSMDDLNAATVADVSDFFATHYLPNNAVLSIVGDVGAEQAFAKAETYFDSLPAGPLPPRPERTTLPPLTGLPRMETSADVPADAVYLTWRLPARDDVSFDATDLAFSILGQGQTSRLHKQLVRRKELAEGTSASTMGLIGGNSFGYVYGRARDGVSPEALEEALLEEIERIRDEGPSEIELRRAKAQYERQWLHELARVDSRADALGEHATLLNDPHLVNSRIGTIDGIDAAAIADAVTDWFTVERRATLIYRQEHP
ncbi:MAG: Zinc protease [uncultured Propionibacteriaceae bacterium]|uniref:Zinc protease n=1 Tax=uncultured Propionibacteriaceae bacterium TaxID=257457 RepID=A0A6J4NH86_9ACTN|nr:MAG: Zinc protease [uncultured Propionibacteriaceae bacterium]